MSFCSKQFKSKNLGETEIKNSEYEKLLLINQSRHKIKL